MTARWRKPHGTMLRFFFLSSIRLSRPRVGYQRAGNMCCPRKRSGSMPAGQARPPRTRGEMISIPPVPIIIGMADRMMETIISKPVMWVSMRPTHGAFLTCREMCGNGSATGRRTILLVPRLIPEGPASGSYRVSRGGSWSTPGRSCVLLGARITPSSRTHPSASVLVSKQSSQTRRIPNWNCSGEPVSRVRPGKPGRSQAQRGTMRGTEI